MAFKRKPKPEPEATESPPEVDEQTQTKQAPVPQNRAILSPAKWIRVKANRNIGELDQHGEMQRYAKGDEFYIDAARAKAIGPQVTVTTG